MSDSTQLRQSIMRRLTRTAEESRVVMRSRREDIAEFTESVRRDLEALLNTRRMFGDIPIETKDLQNTIIHYGIPDFTAANRGTAEDRVALKRAVARVIEDFEPRFAKDSIEVTRVNDEKNERVMVLRISGELLADETPEPVAFDSTIEVTTGNVAVENR